jgi:hypothetical protein
MPHANTFRRWVARTTVAIYMKQRGLAVWQLTAASFDIRLAQALINFP